MKSSQVIEYHKRNIFLQKSGKNEAGKLAPDFFLFSKKALYEIKASCLQLSFNIFRQSSTWLTIKTNRKKIDALY